MPANEQDAIAALILEELEDERSWDEAFAVLLTDSLSLQPRQWLNTVQEKPKTYSNGQEA